MELDTLLLHAGADNAYEGEVVTPIFQSATYATDPRDPPRYIRLNNAPNQQVLGARLAAATGGEAALVTASGMAAITTTLLALLRAGDHVVAQDCLYGGSHAFLRKVAPELGVEVTFVADGDWAAAMRPTTRVLYVETLTNPLLTVTDLEAALACARAGNIVSVVDNTFASPVNLRPLALGFDLELHSATKYLNGHTDIVAGAVAGRADLVTRVRERLDVLGGCLDPHACFLLERGLKTLGLRVGRQNENGLALARLLAAHPAVARVCYPGLETHPGHALARRLLDGYGGVLSFELVDPDPAAADALVGRLQLARPAPSLGGVETLITRPVTTSHASVAAADLARIGLSPHLLRVSVGVEATTDLLADFRQALAAG